MTPTKKILVTGGAGFIGSHLVDRLSADKSNQVIVFDNLSRGKVENLAGSKERLEFIKGDIRDREAVEKAMSGVHTVYHLAAQSNVLGAVTDLDYSFTTNVTGTLEILRAAATKQVKCLVFTSSREVYGEPTVLPVREDAPLKPKNAYGASKMAGEAYCNVFNSPAFRVRILRLANVFGTRDFGRVIPIFADQALRGEAITIFGGKQIIGFVPVDQVLDGLIRAAEAESLPGPINVGTGSRTELPTLARLIIAAADSDSEVRIAPARSVEVAHFVADVKLQEQHLGLIADQNPLSHLPTVIESFRHAHLNRLRPEPSAPSATVYASC